MVKVHTIVILVRKDDIVSLLMKMKITNHQSPESDQDFRLEGSGLVKNI